MNTGINTNSTGEYCQQIKPVDDNKELIKEMLTYSKTRLKEVLEEIKNNNGEVTPIQKKIIKELRGILNNLGNKIPSEDAGPSYN